MVESTPNTCNMDDRLHLLWHEITLLLSHKHVNANRLWSGFMTAERPNLGLFQEFQSESWKTITCKENTCSVYSQ